MRKNVPQGHKHTWRKMYIYKWGLPSETCVHSHFPPCAIVPFHVHFCLFTFSSMYICVPLCTFLSIYIFLQVHLWPFMNILCPFTYVSLYIFLHVHLCSSAYVLRVDIFLCVHLEIGASMSHGHRFSLIMYSYWDKDNGKNNI